MAGIVDPDCDVAQICRETAMHVQAGMRFRLRRRGKEITEEHTGRTPKIEIKDCTTPSKQGSTGPTPRLFGLN